MVNRLVRQRPKKKRTYGTCNICYHRLRTLVDGRMGYHTVANMDYTTNMCPGSYSVSREVANEIIAKKVAEKHNKRNSVRGNGNNTTH